jgi:chromosome segregation ATPase
MASPEEIDAARGRWKRKAKEQDREIQALKARVFELLAETARLRNELDRLTAERNQAVRDIEPMQQQVSAALDAQLAAERRLEEVWRVLDSIPDHIIAVYAEQESEGWLYRLGGRSHYIVSDRSLCGLDATGSAWWGTPDDETPNRPCASCMRHRRARTGT